MVAILKIYMVLCIASTFFSFHSQPKIIVEGLSAGNRNKFRVEARITSSSNLLRRDFLFALACGCATPFLLGTGSSTAIEAPQASVGGRTSNACRPIEGKFQKLSDARAQIDMAVQASSVQAFSEATEFANDKMLDASSLRNLFSESCEDVSSDSVSVVLQSVEKMRSKLNSPNTLTTEDVKEVMRYGTTARSGIDSVILLQ